MKRRLQLGLLAAVLLAFFFGGPLLGIYVDRLWFVEVGHQDVWWRIFSTKLQLGLLFGVGMAAVVYLNVYLARRAGPTLTPRLEDFPLRARMGELAQRGINLALFGGCVVIGLMGAVWAASQWETFLLFRHPQEFGVADPLFDRDVGFYVFTLPFWRFLYQWLVVSLVFSGIAATGVYYLDRAVEVIQGYARVAPGVRAHLSALLGLLALVVAWGVYLGRYELVFSESDVLFGAGWTDTNVRKIGMLVIAAAAVLTAGALFYNVRQRDLRLPAFAGAFLLVVWITVGSLLPMLQQRFVVQPNEQTRERPYIEHHLEFTRRGFGLDRITRRVYPMEGQITREVVDRERGTLDNVRLWDWRQLGHAYQALQSLRGYYDVRDVDIDRYWINGEYRQVMLAARRLDSTQLPQPTWVNQRLNYTHGNGLVMSPVNEVRENGQPVLWMRDLPLVSSVDLQVTRPQIYYSDLPAQAVITPSEEDEFSFPHEEGTARYRYTGAGGISVGNLWRKLVFAISLGDANLLISRQIRPDSKVLIRRRIDERVAHVAPFLKLEHDPYLVVREDGTLAYLIDGYTATNRYPYSYAYGYRFTRLRGQTELGLVDLSRTLGWFNYIRNSVKGVVDAYDGSLQLYVADAEDPLIRAYQEIFPGLLQPLEEMPADLRAHIRYPENLLNIQARVYRAYHVEAADRFYNSSDLWEIAAHEAAEAEERDAPLLPPLRGALQPPGNPPIDPYYLIMNLPEMDGDRGEEEFVLVLPLTYRGREVMSAWLAGRSDGENYGELVLYTYPPGSPPPSPQLVQNRIQAEERISQQITLWQGQGSTVEYGSLQVLPVGGTLLYVRPLYLRARARADATGRTIHAIPELRQVLAVHGDRVVMRPRLDEALTELFGAQPDAPRPTPLPGDPPPIPVDREVRLREIAQRLQDEMEARDRARRDGNWSEYGQRDEAVNRLIRELSQVIGGGGAP